MVGVYIGINILDSCEAVSAQAEHGLPSPMTQKLCYQKTSTPMLRTVLFVIAQTLMVTLKCRNCSCVGSPMEVELEIVRQMREGGGCARSPGGHWWSQQ